MGRRNRMGNSYAPSKTTGGASPKYQNHTMGMGQFALPTTYLKRKYRWTFTVDFDHSQSSACQFQDIPEHYVKSAARPKLEVEELELNFLNQKWWLPGRGVWQTITVTYYDVAVRDAGLTGLWAWIDTIYQIFDRPPTNGLSGLAKIDRQQASVPGQFLGWGQITLYDGCGHWVEYWDLPDCWPQNIDWGELDYSSNDEANIEITMRYANVTFHWNTECQGGEVAGCCTSCNEAGQGIQGPAAPDTYASDYTDY